MNECGLSQHTGQGADAVRYVVVYRYTEIPAINIQLGHYSQVEALIIIIIYMLAD